MKWVVNGAFFIFGMVVGSLLIWSKISGEYLIEKRWKTVIEAALNNPDQIPKTVDRWLERSGRTPSIEECRTNAGEILSFNGHEVPDPKPIGSYPVWGNNQALFLGSTSDKGKFLFACLILGNGKVESTDLIYPEARRGDDIVSIRDSRLLDVQF